MKYYKSKNMVHSIVIGLLEDNTYFVFKHTNRNHCNKKFHLNKDCKKIIKNHYVEISREEAFLEVL